MVSKRIKIKDPTRLKLFCFVIFFITVLLLQSKWLYSSDYQRTKWVVVSAGESLWDIAARYKSDREDIRNYMYKIKEINMLKSSMVLEGQELELPVQ